MKRLKSLLKRRAHLSIALLRIVAAQEQQLKPSRRLQTMSSMVELQSQRLRARRGTLRSLPHPLEEVG